MGKDLIMNKEIRDDILAKLVYETNNIEYILNILCEHIMLLEDLGEPDVDELVNKCNQLKLHADKLKSDIINYVSDEYDADIEVDYVEKEFQRGDESNSNDYHDLHRDNPVEVDTSGRDTSHYRF